MEISFSALEKAVNRLRVFRAIDRTKAYVLGCYDHRGVCESTKSQ